MYPLNRLRQLHLVADENEIAAAGRHGRQVIERNLSRFVDNEEIEGPSLIFATEVEDRPAEIVIAYRSIGITRAHP